MFDFDAGVQAEHRYGENYEVFCNRCNDTVGVMSYDIIRDAIFRTLGRGGVLCPDCRLETCDVCGMKTKMYGSQMVAGPTGIIRLCMGCHVSWELLKENIHDELEGLRCEEPEQEGLKP